MNKKVRIPIIADRGCRHTTLKDVIALLARVSLFETCGTAGAAFMEEPNCKVYDWQRRT